VCVYVVLGQLTFWHQPYGYCHLKVTLLSSLSRTIAGAFRGTQQHLDEVGLSANVALFLDIVQIVAISEQILECRRATFGVERNVRVYRKPRCGLKSKSLQAVIATKALNVHPRVPLKATVAELLFRGWPGTSSSCHLLSVCSVDSSLGEPGIPSRLSAFPQLIGFGVRTPLNSLPTHNSKPQ